MLLWVVGRYHDALASEGMKKPRLVSKRSYTCMGLTERYVALLLWSLGET